MKKYSRILPAIRRGLGLYRDREQQDLDHRNPSLIRDSNDLAYSLEPLLQKIAKGCTECRACQNACAFLSHFDTPKRIVENIDFLSPRGQRIAYECSLCGLCTAVCPEKLDPASLFLEVRRCCVDAGHFDESAYRTILGYEQRGISPLFSWYGFPEGCDTVFFPGCTLPGTRPVVTMKMYRQIQETIPGLGFVLDCCAKPSHDLGRTEYFHSIFNEMNNYFTHHGIHTVITACPNCTKIFRQYSLGLNIRTVYETIYNNINGTIAGPAGLSVSVHDPCAIRDDLNTHQAVRGLLYDLGHTLVEMEHSGKRTLCCGEGGMVGAVNPRFAKSWGAIRRKEAGGQKIVTYCAGCTGYLNRVAPTVHIADLLYRAEATLNGNLKIARSPFTYWNRLRLKRQMKKAIQPKVQRTRPAVIIASPRTR